MHRTGRSRSLGASSLIMLVAAMVAGPAPASALAPPPLAATTGTNSADLSRALDSAGVFRGAPGLTGTIDAHAWTLTSDPSGRTAPHFAPAPHPDAAVPGSDPWKALGSNGHGNGALKTAVMAMAVHLTNLYVGGQFRNAAGIATADYIARWDGSHWHAMGSNGHGNGAINDLVEAIAVSGSNVYVGGKFRNAAGIAKADHIARWDGSHWHALGSNGTQGSIGGPADETFVDALAVQGGNLFVGGAFHNAGGIAKADGIARWDGSHWHALGSNGSGGAPLGGTYPNVAALVIYLGDLYVGGSFEDAGGYQDADYIASWNGSFWASVGPVSPGTTGALGWRVYALAVSGSNLYVGGGFTDAAGTPTADYIARWSGSGWNALGSDGAGDGAIANSVLAILTVGSNVYAAGYWGDAAGNPEADDVARFDGSHWHALGSNGAGGGAFDALGNEYVEALARVGSTLYLGGRFWDLDDKKPADMVVGYVRSHDYSYQPDGRIRYGSAAYVGNNVYDQSFTQQASHDTHGNHSVTFDISIQNDGTGMDRFTLFGSGSQSQHFTVHYFRGTTDITTKVEAKTYRTTYLAPGATFLVTARVTPKASASLGEETLAEMTIYSGADSGHRDSVAFHVKRTA